MVGKEEEDDRGGNRGVRLSLSESSDEERGESEHGQNRPCQAKVY